jgi:hypothetical protein
MDDVTKYRPNGVQAQGNCGGEIAYTNGANLPSAIEAYKGGLLDLVVFWLR